MCTESWLRPTSIENWENSLSSFTQQQFCLFRISMLEDCVWSIRNLDICLKMHPTFDAVVFWLCVWYSTRDVSGRIGWWKDIPRCLVAQNSGDGQDTFVSGTNRYTWTDFSCVMGYTCVCILNSLFTNLHAVGMSEFIPQNYCFERRTKLAWEFQLKDILWPYLASICRWLHAYGGWRNDNLFVCVLALLLNALRMHQQDRRSRHSVFFCDSVVSVGSSWLDRWQRLVLL